MKKPLIFGSLRKNNKGSAMVTVVISMIFVMALGAALLFSTYMSYKIAISQRRSTEAFYTAETMADDIRFGLQTEAARALKIAYTETMTEYARATNTSFDPQTEFAGAFEREILSSKADEMEIFSENGKGYNPSAFSAYVNAPEGAGFSLGSGGKYESSGTNNIYSGEVRTSNDEEGRLTELCLIKLGLRYLSDDGYESRIITDITISIPDFFAKPIASEGLSSYAIVADKGIAVKSGGESTISGKAFAGSLSVNGNNNKLTHSGGDLIVKGTGSGTDGKVTVGADTSFGFNSAGNELWAGEIEVDGNFAMTGRTYAADDLIMGAGGKVKLSGSYFGFGSSFTNPNQSSAIIVNGQGASLDILGLERLSLGGISFIDVFGGGLYKELEGEEIPPVPMGESLSIKTNQLAYLVPAECLEYYAANPFIFDSGEGFDPDYINLDTELWTIAGKKKTLKDYLGIAENNTNPEGSKGELAILYKPLVEENATLTYVFLQFSEQKYANEYFKDFFTVYPDRISEYMKIYLELSDKAEDAKISSAGNAFYMKDKGLEGEALTLIPANTPWTKSLQSRYNMLKSPFSSFVNTENFNKLPPETELKFYDGSNLAAVVTKGIYNHTPKAGESLSLIIASDNVGIFGENSFKGIVLTNGQLLLDGNIIGQLLSPDILKATAEDTQGNTYTLSDFIASGLASGSASEGDNPWAPEKLVYYENWTKN